jgi:methionyl-tRNA formyltransferase
MKLVEKMDAGPIYLQEATAVAPDETTSSLQAKLTPIGARLLLETLRRLKAGSLIPEEQDESAVTFAPILRKEDGLIDWAQPAMTIERRVRGFDPWPGAYSHIGGKLLKIHRARVVAADTKGSRGEVMRADAGGRSLGRHWLRLTWFGRSPVGKQKKAFRCRVPKRDKD